MLKSTKSKINFIVLSVLLVPSLLIILGLSMIPDKVEISEKEYYNNYLASMDDYGLEDVEQLMDNYFTDELIGSMDVDGVKKSFSEIGSLGFNYKGKVVKVEKVEDETYVYVEEWLEEDGDKKASGIMNGVYVLVNDKKTGYRFNQILGTEVKDSTDGYSESESTQSDYEDLDGWDLESDVTNEEVNKETDQSDYEDLKEWDLGK